jgi:hypothetical protein
MPLNAAITIQFKFKFDCVLIISRIVDVEALDRMLAGGVLTKDCERGLDPRRRGRIPASGYCVMRFGYSMPTIVVGAGAILATAMAGVLVALQAATGRQSSNLTGRVQIGADSCQSFVIDHKTGFISKDQRAACAATAKESKRKIARQPVPVALPDQAGVRVDTVRDSFNKR